MGKESKVEQPNEEELILREEEYLPETRYVVQLGYGMFFIFLAFNTQGFYEGPFIKSTPSIDNRSIYNSGAIVYCVAAFSNLIAAPIVDLLSAKWAMFLGGICYALFMIGFLFLNEIYLYIASAILGFGASIVWTGQGTYLTRNSTVEKSGRNSATVWAMLQLSMFAGGIFLYVTSLGGSGGAIPAKTIFMLSVIFTVLSIVGLAIFAFLPTPPAHISPIPVGSRRSLPVLIISPFRLLFTRNMLLLAVVFAYTGVLQYFWMNIYASSISMTKAFGMNPTSLVGLNALVSGVGQCIAGGIFVILYSKPARLGREIFVAIGAIIHLVAFVLVFINFPSDANQNPTDKLGYIKPSVAIALVTGFLLGFGDACWNVQIYTHLVANYQRHSSPSFALYKFFQALLYAAAFFYAPSLTLPYHLLILLIFSLLAVAAFFLVERMTKSVQIRESFEQLATQSDPHTNSFSAPQAAYANSAWSE